MARDPKSRPRKKSLANINNNEKCTSSHTLGRMAAGDAPSRGVSTRGDRRAEISSTEPPLISLQLLRAGDRGTLRSLRDALHVAPGWFLLDASDEIPSELVTQVYSRAREFFASPLDLKRSYHHKQYARETGGYVPLLEEYAYQANQIAVLESFDTVRDISAAKLPKEFTGVGPVDWPCEVPGMKQALGGFYKAADVVARDLLVGFAKACFVPDDDDGDVNSEKKKSTEEEYHRLSRALADQFLRDFTERSACSMRVMRYPGSEDKDTKKRINGELKGFEERSEKDQSKKSGNDKKRKRDDTKKQKATAVGIAEHTDFEAFTLLHQTCVGIQLKDKASTWRCAGNTYPNIKSVYTVIVGDALEFRTNGFFKATPHRVELTKSERFSIVRFNGFDPTASIAPFVCERFKIQNTNNHGNKTPKRNTTQGEHLVMQVTKAAKHLENAAQLGLIPGVDSSNLNSSKAPVKFAQLLILDTCDDGETKVLLGKHKSGEFEGQYTGMITQVAPFETAQQAALRAVRNAGLELVSDGNENETDERILDTRVCERGRFRFTGWLPRPQIAVEHEFAVRLGDGVKIKPLGETEKGESKKVDPCWFTVDAIPYTEMPADDAVWYPLLLALELDSEKERENVQAGDSILIGSFDFDDGGFLVDSKVEKIVTDAAL